MKTSYLSTNWKPALLAELFLRVREFWREASAEKIPQRLFPILPTASPVLFQNFARAHNPAG